MAIYFALAAEVGRVKVGFTDYPQLRFNKLQSDCPVDLKIVRLLEGGRKEEDALHARFAALHHRGDWFTFTDEMMGDLGLADYAMPKSARQSPNHPLARYLQDQSIDIAEFAMATGTTASSIYRYIAGDRVPHRAILSRIVAVTKGKVTANDFYLTKEAA